MSHMILFGNDVCDAYNARREAWMAGERSSDRLCRFQESEAGKGLLEAALVKSMYGWSVRYASGLQDFGLIASSRSGQLDGTYEGACEYARKWQEQDPTRRFVSVSAYDLSLREKGEVK